MAIIYSYPIKITPVGSDTMIISDLEDRKLTKQISLSQLKPLVDTTYTFNNQNDPVLGNTVDLQLTDSDATTQTVQVTGTGDVTITSLSAAQFTINALGDKTFVYEQTNAATLVWTITHNLNKNPSVTVLDTAGENIFGQVAYTDLNNLTITFTSGFRGFAYLN